MKTHSYFDFSILFSYDVSKYYKFSFSVSTCKRKVTNILLIYEQEVLIKNIEVDKIVFLVDITNGKNHFQHWLNIYSRLFSCRCRYIIGKSTIMSLFGFHRRLEQNIPNCLGYSPSKQLVKLDNSYL